MTNKEYIAELVKRGKAAEEIVEFYDQEQTDRMTKAVAMAIVDHATQLGTLALEETRMGNLKGKIVKNNVAGMVWNDLKDKPSVGVLSEDKEKGIITIAKPMGVIAAVTPTTNPTSTVGYYATICIKGRNALIVAPHPRAVKCTNLAVTYIREALKSVGAPEDLCQCIGSELYPEIQLSNELTAQLMSDCDAIIATGSEGMVKAAYACGRPCFGVGQGNVQVIVDEDYTDYDLIADNILRSRPGDFGTACTGEQNIFIPEAHKNEIINAFLATGKCYFLEDQDKIQKMREGIFPNNGPINRAVVGQAPQKALEAIGVEIPECKLLLVDLNSYGPDEPLAREVMFPVLRVSTYKTFEEGIMMASVNLKNEGAGHSSDLYSKNVEHIHYAANRLPVARLLIEQQNAWSSGNTDFNGLAPGLSIGCGTWGNNSVSENIEYRHLLNLTKISYRLWDAKRTGYAEWFDVENSAE